jgi:hypothetical protein
LVAQLVADQLKRTRVFHKKPYKCFGGVTLCDRASSYFGRDLRDWWRHQFGRATTCEYHNLVLCFFWPRHHSGVVLKGSNAVAVRSLRIYNFTGIANKFKNIRDYQYIPMYKHDFPNNDKP